MTRDINPANEEYYIYLEDLRKSGVTNMFGAAPYLVKEFDISLSKATVILMEWMQNYEELSKKYGWR